MSKTTPGLLAAELLGQSGGVSGAYLGVDRRPTADHQLRAGQVAATAAGAAAGLELARQQQTQNLLKLAELSMAAGPQMGLDPRIGQAALQLAVHALLDLDVVLADNGE